MPVMGESKDEDYIIPVAKGTLEDIGADVRSFENAVILPESSSKKKVIHKGSVLKIQGVGPTENGLPITPRGNVDDEHAGDWYRTMYKRLHTYQKPKDDQEVITVRVERGLSHYRDDCHISEPDHTPEERRRFSEKRWPYEHPTNDTESTKPYSAYRVLPKRIEDYQPGDSSIESYISTALNDTMHQSNRRNTPQQDSSKPKYVFNEDDSYRMVKIAKENSEQYPPSKFVQREWYRSVQKGSDIPLGGFRRPLVPPPKDPIIGPCPNVQRSKPSDNNLTETLQQIEEQKMSADRDYEDLKAMVQMKDHELERARQDMMLRRVYDEVDQHVRRQQDTKLFASDLDGTLPHNQGNRAVGDNASVYETVFFTPDNKEVIMLGRVIYDFMAHASKELNLKKGDLVYIFKKLDRNWYEGECLGKTGIFPVRYVDAFPPSSIDTLANVQIQEGIATGRYAFFAKNPTELSFKVGDKLRLIRRIDHNWFEARIGNQQGLVPENYLTVVQEPTEMRKN